MYALATQTSIILFPLIFLGILIGNFTYILLSALMLRTYLIGVIVLSIFTDTINLIIINIVNYIMHVHS